MLIAVSKLIGELKINDHNDDLLKLMSKNDSVDVRMAALDALNQLQYPKVAEAISMGMNDKSPRMRASAIADE